MTSILRTSANIFVSTLVVLSAFVGNDARAQTLDPMRVERFESDITVQEDATMHVVETISVRFLAPRHGLLRTIPVTYDAGLTRQSIGLTVIDVTANGQSSAFTTSTDGGNLTVKIGDPDVYVEGLVVYELTYDVNRAFLYHDLTDELYWNVTGDAWESGIPETEVTVRVPGVVRQDLDVSCYVGRYGSTDQTCTTSIDDGVVRSFASDFLTLSVSFPKDVIQEPGTGQTLVWWMQDNWPYAFSIVPVFVFFILYRHWQAKGKDPKGRGVEMVEYEPPQGLRPTEMGTLTDTHMHDRDFAAGLVDLAVRGYVRFVEETGTFGFGKKYTIEKVKEADVDLKPFEREMIEKIFDGKTSVSLSGNKGGLVKARESVEKIVSASMQDEGYFEANPTRVKAKYIGWGTGIVVATHVGGVVLGAMIPHGAPIYLAGMLSGVLVIVFGQVMTKRTQKGTEAFDKANGFKLYLSQAEQHRLQWQEQEQVFETFLPYAMVFGVVDKWTTAVGSTIASSPAWFVGPGPFDPLTFGSRINSAASALSMASAPAKSGGSGGGGFSGGGFGGGGGGSW